MSGELSMSVDANGFPLVWVQFKGFQSNNLIVTQYTVFRNSKNRAYIQCRCLSCNKTQFKEATSLKLGKAGCGVCGRRSNSSKPVLDVPRWLLNRCISAKQRCTNPNERRYQDYGGRGIEFRFNSSSLMGRWIMDNIPGWSRHLQIDRKDNNGHYEPGNLQMVRPVVNMNNQRTSHATKQLHLFRMLYPEVRYADKTLVGFFQARMSFEEVRHRFFNLNSCKPKGLYGTFLTPDQEIVSLVRD